MSEYSPCAICGRPSVHTHHRKLRSQGGDNSEANLMRLCLSHHNHIHNNPKQSYENGWMVHSWDDPALIPVLTEGEQGIGESAEAEEVPHDGRAGALESAPPSPSVSPGEKTPSSLSEMIESAARVLGRDKSVDPPLHSHPQPGEKCPACARRIPLPKKPSSPTTKVFSVRVPIDDLEAWEEALDAASEHLGIGTKAAHHRFKTLNAGLALILQSPKGLLE